jgi:hypothetical protein
MARKLLQTLMNYYIPYSSPHPSHNHRQGAINKHQYTNDKAPMKDPSLLESSHWSCFLDASNDAPDIQVIGNLWQQQL